MIGGRLEEGSSNMVIWNIPFLFIRYDFCPTPFVESIRNVLSSAGGRITSSY